MLITDLEYMISDVVNLYNRRVSFAKLRTEHVAESWRSCDEDDLVSVEDAAFDSKLNVAQLRIVDKFGIDSSAAIQNWVADPSNWLPPKTSLKYIC